MQVPVLGFIPPVEGVDGDYFNTFRLGQAYAKRVQPGSQVFLLDEKNKMVFGRAEVIDVVLGTLKQLCMLHAKLNHREIGKADPLLAGDRLFTYLQKLYGPQIATENKKATVIYLKRLPDVQSGPEGHTPVREAQE